MAKTIQSIISTTDADTQYLKKTTGKYENFNYFLGGIDVTQQNLDKFNPYIQGVSRIFLYTPPTFMDKIFPDQTKNFKAYIQTGYTRIDGIGDISVEFTDFEGGFAGQRFSNVSLSRDDTDTLTITVYEQSGSMIREYLDTWISGTRDPRSGIAHYHGAIDEADVNKKTPYAEKHHTAEFIYITMDPTGKAIEYACMFAHAFPTKVSKSHLNYEKGNRDSVLMDLEFKVTKYESPAINQIGIWYLQNSVVGYNYLDFNPTYITEETVTSNIA